MTISSFCLKMHKNALKHIINVFVYFFVLDFCNLGKGSLTIINCPNYCSLKNIKNSHLLLLLFLKETSTKTVTKYIAFEKMKKVVTTISPFAQD